MAISTDGRRNSLQTWGSTLANPVGARFNTETDVKANQPGIVITDEAIAIEAIRHFAEFKYQGIATPPTPGAKHDAVATFQSFANSLGGSGTPGTGGFVATLPDAINVESEIDGDSSPVVQRAKYRYTGTSNQPITVA